MARVFKTDEAIRLDMARVDLETYRHLAKMFRVINDETRARLYDAKADEIENLIGA